LLSSRSLFAADDRVGDIRIATPCNGDFSAIWSLRGDELRFLSVRSDLGDRTLWGAKPFRKIG
jgi:hypothetical protein